MRVADSCTRLEDALAIAALYRCLVRLAVRTPQLNRDLTGASRALVAENLWRAQRDGVHAHFIEEAAAAALPFRAHLESIFDRIAEDADALGCRPEVEHAREIARAGTSADHQIAIFEKARKQTRRPSEALSAVVDWLASTTAGSSSPES